MARKGKVYVIDDDEAMRDSLQFLLDSADFEVSLFDSAQTFLDQLSTVEIGCVVSDIRMPGVDGIELLRRFPQSARAAGDGGAGGWTLQQDYRARLQYQPTHH